MGYLWIVRSKAKEWSRVACTVIVFSSFGLLLLVAGSDMDSLYVRNAPLLTFQLDNGRIMPGADIVSGSL